MAFFWKLFDIDNLVIFISFLLISRPFVEQVLFDITIHFQPPDMEARKVILQLERTRRSTSSRFHLVKRVRKGFLGRLQRNWARFKTRITLSSFLKMGKTPNPNLLKYFSSRCALSSTTKPQNWFVVDAIEEENTSLSPCCKPYGMMSTSLNKWSSNKT